MNYLFAAQSLAYLAASLLWVGVWKAPSAATLAAAALGTAFSLALASYRLGFCVVMGHAC